MSKPTRGDFVLITVPANKEPFYGWGTLRPFMVGVVYGVGSKAAEVYSPKPEGGSMYSSAVLFTELKTVKHPFQLHFAALGKGVVTAVVDAASREDAVGYAYSMLSDPALKDAAGRSIGELGWDGKKGEVITPVLAGVTDLLYSLDAYSKTILK